MREGRDADSSVAQADAAAEVFFDKAQCNTVATLLHTGAGSSSSCLTAAGAA